MMLRKMNVIELQDFFNAFYPRLSPKSIRPTARLFACSPESSEGLGNG